jgi:predicted Zn-dependent protease with MMP-like domain
MSRALRPAERERFDALVEDVLASLPAAVHEMLEESPLIVEDFAPRALIRDLGLDPDEDDLCGLHSGFALTQRSVSQSGEVPDQIQIFRRGIIDAAGGWEPGEDEEGPFGGLDAVREQVRITILHEIGHHFGLDEDDLGRLGYA